MLRRLRGGNVYQELLKKEPHVVSITFWRDEIPIDKDNNTEDIHKLPKLGIAIDKVQAEEEGERSGGDYQITDIQDNPDSILYGMPIEVGDLLVAVNSQSCYGLDIDLLKQMIATETGIVTLTLRKTRMAPFQDELRLAVFIDSQEHTCIPMDICLFKEEEKLSIFALYDNFDMDKESNGNKNKNDWLESSCLAEGQVLLSINDRPTYQSDEDEALAIMNETIRSDEVLAIKTYYPSRASTSEAPDMVDRVGSYIIQLEHRMNRSFLVQAARNDNDDLNFAASAFPVFSSAVQLDKTLLGAYNRCISITTGKPLFRLYIFMDGIWSKYAQILIRKFPQDSRFSKVWRSRLPASERVKVAQQEEMGDCASAEDGDENTGDNKREEVEAAANKREEVEAAANNASTGRGWLFSRRQETPEAAPEEKTEDETPSLDAQSEDQEDEFVDTPVNEVENVDEKKNATETPSSGRGWWFSRRTPETPKEDSQTKGDDQSEEVSVDQEDSNPETTEPKAAAEENATPKQQQSRSWFFSRSTAAENKSKLVDKDENSIAAAKSPRSGKKDNSGFDRTDKEANIRATICYVICTGNYCLDVLTERESALKEKIDEGLEVQIDFAKTRKLFRDEVIESGILQLIDSVKFQSEPIFLRMMRIRWHKCEEVGDTSPYAMEVVMLLKKRITSLLAQLPPKIHRKVKYDLVEAICDAFYESLARINRISPVGTQQLLLDVCTLKLEFLGLLRISEPATSAEEDDFVDDRMNDPREFVNEQLKKPEALLKLADTNVGVDELLGRLFKNPANGNEEGDENDETGKDSGVSDESVPKPSENDLEEHKDDEDDETTIVFDHLEDMDTTLESPAFQEDLEAEDPDAVVRAWLEESNRSDEELENVM